MAARACNDLASAVRYPRDIVRPAGMRNDVISMRSVARKYSTNWFRKLLIILKRIKFWQKRRNSLRTGKGSYGFGHQCHCTIHVPRGTSFYRCYSFNSDFDESDFSNPGTLSVQEVYRIAVELGPSWKAVGRVLNVPAAVIDQIEEDMVGVAIKCFCKCNCVVFGVIMG